MKPESLNAIIATVKAAGKIHGADIEDVTVIRPDRSDERDQITDADLVFAPERKGLIYSEQHKARNA